MLHPVGDKKTALSKIDFQPRAGKGTLKKKPPATRERFKCKFFVFDHDLLAGCNSEQAVVTVFEIQNKYKVLDSQYVLHLSIM